MSAAITVFLKEVTENLRDRKTVFNALLGLAVADMAAGAVTASTERERPPSEASAELGESLYKLRVYSERS